MGPTAMRRAAARLTMMAAALLALVGTFGATLGAHALSSSTSRITVEGRVVRVVFTINLTDLHAGPVVDTDGDGFFTVDEVDHGIEVLYASLKAHFQIVSEGAPPRSTVVDRYELVDDSSLQMHLSYAFAEPVRRLTLTSTLDRITQPDHRHLSRVDLGAGTREGVLDRSMPAITLDAARPEPTGRAAWRFIRLGIEHIFTGYDHLAFLLGLLLMATTLGATVKVVTSFTAAHSVTLALATFGLVSLPGRLIESVIALSIAYVAIENLLGVSADRRWRLTFLFGLVHGFGFSNVLRQMELPRQALALSLFTFNAGVEVGQVLFVLIVFPLIAVLTAARWKHQLLPACSAAILFLGTYWFVQRALLG